MGGYRSILQRACTIGAEVALLSGVYYCLGQREDVRSRIDGLQIFIFLGKNHHHKLDD